MIRYRRPFFQRLSRFTLIGVTATLVYAAGALLLSSGVAGGAPLPAAAASTLAYLVAGISSYVGHKYFTFASPGSHAAELPKFILTNIAGLGVAALLPAVFTGMFDAPAGISIMAICLIVPAMNFFVFERWVFRNV